MSIISVSGGSPCLGFKGGELFPTGIGMSKKIPLKEVLG
jgi:hypothetical protein